MMPTPKPIDISQYSRIVILTGAGVSAASGLPTFRGADGLLQDDVKWVSDAANLPASLPGLWKLYGGLRRSALQAQPNAAHLAIAALESNWGTTRSITLATQNVDELHQRAGSKDVVELHGSILRTRCMNAECPSMPFEDVNVPEESVPLCPQCRSALRPDIILFNEPLPVDTQWRVKKALRDCDLFIAVGTSGTVSPASEFVRSAEYAGARTILINLTPMMPRNPYFQEEYLGSAEELLPALLSQ
jgi:NAD-dependent deacetylase